MADWPLTEERTAELAAEAEHGYDVSDLGEPRIVNGLRTGLPPMPAEIAALPVRRGYPVPWFVAWMDDNGEPVERGTGTPDFRVLHPNAIAQAHNGTLCWVCGQKRGGYAAFVAGPMCGINRISAEPSSHISCARWSAQACPFLARPHAHRREHDLPEGAEEPAGVMIKRNPGVAMVWVARSYAVKRDPNGQPLFRFGPAVNVEFYAHGRKATRAEVETSVETGIHHLEEHCFNARDRAALRAERARFETLLPSG